MKDYDVIIIGAGPSGIFCACRLKELDPDIEILMIEKGRSIEDRSCPKRVTKECVGCRPCSITTGLGGGLLRWKAVPLPGCGRHPAGNTGV